MRSVVTGQLWCPRRSHGPFSWTLSSKNVFCRAANSGCRESLSAAGGVGAGHCPMPGTVDRRNVWCFICSVSLTSRANEAKGATALESDAHVTLAFRQGSGNLHSVPCTFTTSFQFGEPSP